MNEGTTTNSANNIVNLKVRDNKKELQLRRVTRNFSGQGRFLKIRALR